MRLVLKRTKKKPIPGFDLSSGKVAYKYLYTSSGEASSWNVAMWFVVEKGSPVPDELVLDMQITPQEGRS